jgi:hypothetical protein
MAADRYEAEARALLASSTIGDTARERGEWDSYDAWRASPNDVCTDIAAALRDAERRGAERERNRAIDAVIAARKQATQSEATACLTAVRDAILRGPLDEAGDE